MHLYVFPLLWGLPLGSFLAREPLFPRNDSPALLQRDNVSRNGLIPRHYCKTPNYSLCSNPDFCCPIGNECCNGGVTGCANPAGTCCAEGSGSCNEGLTCCEYGCAPTGHRCCRTGDSCPPGSNCYVTWDGHQVCCTGADCFQGGSGSALPSVSNSTTRTLPTPGASATTTITITATFQAQLNSTSLSHPLSVSKTAENVPDATSTRLPILNSAQHTTSNQSSVSTETSCTTDNTSRFFPATSSTPLVQGTATSPAKISQGTPMVMKTRALVLCWIVAFSFLMAPV